MSELADGKTPAGAVPSPRGAGLRTPVPLWTVLAATVGLQLLVIGLGVAHLL